MGEGCVCEAHGTSPLVCVPLSTISFRKQEHAEDVEASDDNEEAEEEEGRSNGFQSAIRTPLAVISHVYGLFQGCVSVMVCLFKGRCVNQFCNPSALELLSIEIPNPLLGRGVWGNELCECPHPLN
jgi:hypothetical protein